MFDLEPLSPTIGADVIGFDMSRPVHETTRSWIDKMLDEWKVLFFRDQQITVEQHVAFARAFGELEVHPFANHVEGVPEAMILLHDEAPPAEGQYQENIWHSDVSWRDIPSKASVLRAREVPPVGGDTLWADMAAVFESFPIAMQRFLETLRAVHDFYPAFWRTIPADRLAEMRASYPPVEHPVVRTHPTSGRKMLYVNESFTTHVVGFAPRESKELLHFLTGRARQPEFQCRFRWRPDSVAMWDNRATQHYANQDYWPALRRMERVTIIGDRPV